MNKKQSAALTAHFEHQWNNPPKPFNPDYDPKKAEQWRRATIMADSQAKREGVSKVPTERAERVTELREMFFRKTITDADLKEALDYYWED